MRIDYTSKACRLIPDMGEALCNNIYMVLNILRALDASEKF
jgi:hypothetical protein